MFCCVVSAESWLLHLHMGSHFGSAKYFLNLPRGKIAFYFAFFLIRRPAAGKQGARTVLTRLFIAKMQLKKAPGSSIKTFWTSIQTNNCISQLFPWILVQENVFCFTNFCKSLIIFFLNIKLKRKSFRKRPLWDLFCDRRSTGTSRFVLQAFFINRTLDINHLKESFFFSYNFTHHTLVV